MKKLVLVTLALAALTAAPAAAQSYNPAVGSGNIVAGPKGGMETGAASRPLYDYAPMTRNHHSGRFERQ
jgi:hypothetical protein